MTAIYVHIPYCIKKCRYCDFCSVPKDESADRYCDALIREIELRRASLADNESVETVFFGGGTPTVLNAEDIRRVLEHIKNRYPVSKDAEISIECNPKTADYAGLATLRAAGFNRLSVGLQSADDRLLSVIGRAHSFSDFEETMRLARAAGFENINVDVMHGLPMQTQQSYLDTLKIVCDFEPQHVSAYSLILEEGTELKRLVKAKELMLPFEDEVADMQDAGMDYLESRGYRRYEISNFAKEGFECRHNLTYWNNKPYLGFGVAAHSSVPDRHMWLRFSNTESIKSYLKKTAANKLPTAETIKLNKSEQMFETVMLGLRKTEGIDRAEFFERFEVDIDEYFREAIAAIGVNGWWEDDEKRLRLNRRGMDLQNSALLYFR
ncbi:MAG: radical SAM family heme chaperone HemW [Clostridia bacterium]|nr:radical SAM family heme chaperone HemW [Clostridia bacterium]